MATTGVLPAIGRWLRALGRRLALFADFMSSLGNNELSKSLFSHCVLFSFIIFIASGALLFACVLNGVCPSFRLADGVLFLSVTTLGTFVLFFALGLLFNAINEIATGYDSVGKED